MNTLTPEIATSLQGPAKIRVDRFMNAWSYVETEDGRDLRIDMIRGLVMLVLVTVHIEIFSLYNLFVWERIGIVSGAEGFVLLSGIVVGMVYRGTIAKLGWKPSIWKLLDRSVQLWRLNVAMILLVALLNWIPHVNVRAVMTFNDRVSGQAFSLFPASGISFHEWLAQAMLLRVGPHQIQVLGLYICLLALSPFALFLMSQGRTFQLLALSWVVYFYNWAYPSMPTGAQFEYGFPLLTWQLLYFHGQAAGYHRKTVLAFFKTSLGRFAFVLAIVFFLLLFFWAQNVPNPVVPSFARLSLIPASFYYQIYGKYMMKNSLGPLRVLDDACVLIAVYALLSRFWKPIHRAIGWFFIPLGQASLYVFIVHLLFIVIISDVLPFGFPLDHPHFWINTLAHTFALISLWLMVRYRVLFRWIPR